MSGDDDGFDPRDWLTSQFADGAKDAEDDDSKSTQKPNRHGAADDAVAAPVEPAPPASSRAAGFNWALKPSSPVQAPEPELPPTEAYTPPPLVAPSATPSADIPTQAMSLDDVAEAQSAEASTNMPTQAYTPQTWEPFAERSTPVFPPTPSDPIVAPDPAPAAPQPATSSDDPTTALDALFAENRFEEYAEVGVMEAVAPLIGERQRTVEPKPQHAPLTTLQKTLMWVAGALVAVLALIALFLLGEKLGAASAAPPVAAHTSGASATPQTASTGGPVSAGTHLWNQLNGGECLQPFTSAWATKFTVVGCGAPHVGQLLFKGTLPDASGSAYPSSSQFASEIKPLCISPTVINYDAAKAVSDLQVTFSYPPSAKDWSGGDRTYYCFVKRASGDPLPGSFAVAK